MENIHKNKALEILSERLDDKAIEAFLKISMDMENFYKAYPEMDMAQAREIIENFFSERSESKEFIDKWINKAKAHCEKYGIDEASLPKALVADLGMFRFMSLLEENGFTQEEIFQVFSGAAHQVSDVEFKTPENIEVEGHDHEHKCSGCHHDGCGSHGGSSDQ